MIGALFKEVFHKIFTCLAPCGGACYALHQNLKEKCPKITKKEYLGYL